MLFRSSRIAELQKKLSGANDFLDALLKKGTATSGLTEIGNAVDSKYGPRTELAIQAVLSLIKSAGGPKEAATAFSRLTQKDYNKVMKIGEQELGNLTTEQLNVTAELIKKQYDIPDSALAEYVSYKKDLLNSTKKRYKNLEKLVFERLVKSCK